MWLMQICWYNLWSECLKHFRDLYIKYLQKITIFKITQIYILFEEFHKLMSKLSILATQQMSDTSEITIKICSNSVFSAFS